MLEVIKLEKYSNFPDNLQDFDLIILSGPSGSGKTTLRRHLINQWGSDYQNSRYPLSIDRTGLHYGTVGKVRKTKKNSASSRAHTVHLLENGKCVIDLCGNERPTHTTSDEEYEESLFINKSLAKLKECLIDLHKGRKNISVKSNLVKTVLPFIKKNKSICLVIRYDDADPIRAKEALSYASFAGLRWIEKVTKPIELPLIEDPIEMIEDVEEVLVKVDEDEFTEDELRRFGHKDSYKLAEMFTGMDHRNIERSVIGRILIELNRVVYDVDSWGICRHHDLYFNDNVSDPNLKIQLQKYYIDKKIEDCPSCRK